jgi:hypothetical protein
MSASPSNNFISEGNGHKFCYLYWEHGPGSKTSIYYLDTPDPLDAKADGVFVAEEELKSFVERMQQIGWQIVKTSANQEAYEVHFSRIPPPADGYEECVYCIEVNGPPRAKNLYRLGERNVNMVLELPSLKDDQVVPYLQDQGWVLTHQEEYPSSKSAAHVLTQLNFFRRPLA